MEDFECLDQFLNSPSSSDNDLKQRMPWQCHNEDQNSNSYAPSMINSSFELAQDASSDFLISASDYKMVLNPCEDRRLHDTNCFVPSSSPVTRPEMPWLCHNEDQNSNSYTTSMINSRFELAQDASSDFLISDSDYKMVLNPCEDQSLHDTKCFVPSSSHVTYPELGNSQIVFQSFPNVLQPSHAPSFEGVSSISHHGSGQNGTRVFGFEEGQYFNHSSNFPVSLSSKDLRNYPLPETMTSKSNGLQSLSQTSAITQPGECDNKIGKQRARARRGQATDPHSISERIRREKIADRMKNLQELLPNLNKTDKASSLDEIIEYVKFLQLQVKVLSTSRAGAVVPHITDSQAEGGKGFLVPPHSGKLKSDIVFGSDETAFERELVKLMDSNVNKAIEFLQTKGLSLMPVSLASDISPASGAHRPASNGSKDNTLVKPDEAENNIPFTATEPNPKS